METYSLLREFADSWMLLFLFGFFTLVVLWVFRPGSRQEYRDTASIPFRNEDAPAAATAAMDKETRG
ncbi:MAG: cbb3-type cytochrome c oxidase subunit 3 [Cognatishimia sp.]